MVHTPLLNLSGIGGTGDKLENLGQTASREKSPLEQAAQGIATDTVKNRVTTAASAALLSLGLTFGTPAVAGESPYVPLADASGKTQLVLKEEVKTEQEMLQFLQNNDEAESVGWYNNIPKDSQKRILALYNLAKEKKLTIDDTSFIVSYGIIAMRDLEGNKQYMKYYQETGKIWEGNKGLVARKIRNIMKTLPSADILFDIATYEEIDTLTLKIIDAIIAQNKQEIAQNKQEIAQINEDIKKLRAIIQLLNQKK